MTQDSSLPFNAASLVFIEDAEGRLLLLERNKAPNQGMWSPIGGKIETSKGESPFECAVRETLEETGFSIQPKDLHLFGLVTEKAYEHCSHWFLFLFYCKKPITQTPPPFGEGRFAFFKREEIQSLKIPQTDRQALWTLFDKHRNDFVVLSAHFEKNGALFIQEEQIILNK